jgi:hypothetical protein
MGTKAIREPTGTYIQEIVSEARTYHPKTRDHTTVPGTTVVERSNHKHCSRLTKGHRGALQGAEKLSK